jgi:hypothetical protein
VEQAGKWGSENRSLTPAAGARQFRAFDRCGARGRAARTARTRAASGLRPEALRPPARSWLTATRYRVAESAARCSKENAAMERRKARRPRMAGDLWPDFRRSAQPRGEPPGASVNRASAVQRSIPLIFFERERTKAQPARHDKRAAQRWLFDN